MSEWKELTLTEAGITLIDCDHKTPSPAEEGLPYVAIPQMKNGYIDFSEARLISEGDFNVWTRKANPQVHDVVLSRRCNPGESAYVAEGMKFALGQNLVLLRSDGKLVKKTFLRWLIKSPFWWAEVRRNINVGAVFSSLKCGEIVNFTIPIPPPEEQEGITKTLSCLDRKIENLRKQNETLEKIAQTLFKHWFVDFEFPNADGKPYKSSGGEMVRSAIGDIPAGWRVGKLGDEFDITMGQSPAGSSYNEEGEGLIFFQGRTDFGFRFPQVRLFTSEPKRMANKFDVLVSVRAPVGDINVAFERCCIGRGLSAVSSKYKSYCLYKLKSYKKFFDVFETEGTVFGSLNKQNFNDLESVIPNAEIVESFDSTILPLDKKVFLNERQIQTLTKTRDVLLPQLMSGKLRITDGGNSL